MAYNKNECLFSGKLSDIRQINTKTGNPMSSFRLMCWREQIRCVGFGEVAGDMLSFNDGDRVLLTGKIQSSNWEKDGVKVYSYQVIVETVTPDTASKPKSRRTVQSNEMQKRANGGFDTPPPGGPF